MSKEIMFHGTMVKGNQEQLILTVEEVITKKPKQMKLF